MVFLILINNTQDHRTVTHKCLLKEISVTPSNICIISTKMFEQDNLYVGMGRIAHGLSPRVYLL